jgi:hypothetical protein
MRNSKNRQRSGAAPAASECDAENRSDLPADGNECAIGLLRPMLVVEALTLLDRLLIDINLGLLKLAIFPGARMAARAIPVVVRVCAQEAAERNSGIRRLRSVDEGHASTRQRLVGEAADCQTGSMTEPTLLPRRFQPQHGHRLGREFMLELRPSDRDLLFDGNDLFGIGERVVVLNAG